MTPRPPDSFLRVVFAGVVPREGGDAATTEDRFAVAHHIGFTRAAVADGASDGIFADRWATLWADNWVASPRKELPQLRQEWRESFSHEALPWHMQTRASRGAALAFVGVQVFWDGEWFADGIGDCMLFFVNERGMKAAFPYKGLDDFPDLPLLLHTNPVRGNRDNHDTEADFHHTKGKMADGDELLLMSDALAFWFLKEAADDRNPYVWLSHLSTPETFTERVRQLRMSGRLKDDDTTLVHLRYSNSSP